MPIMGKKINVAILNSTSVRIGPYAKQGTEIFANILINGLSKFKRKELNITAFCSGDSQVSVKKESVIYRPTLTHKGINKAYPYFDIALVSKAISMQKKFAIFHTNLHIGEYILPFAQFTKKPIVITLHGNTDEKYVSIFLSLFNTLSNVFFIPISNYQKKFVPSLHYLRTIYHGVNTAKYKFNPLGGKNIIWTGRAVPEKGLDTVLFITNKLKKNARIFPLMREEYLQWLFEEVMKKRDLMTQIVKVHIEFNATRASLVTEYQNSKVFLFPLRWEEPFGLTLIESLACGTPIIAYARGSIPEIIKDGETGFIVNSSEDDVRGNWIIKKTGVEGLCEAVERIYAMPDEEYRQMRKNCRAHVEKNFTIEHMIDQYAEVYKEILAKKQ